MEKIIISILRVILHINVVQKIMCKSSNVAKSQPNIVFILVDDLGYNDVGYHNPNIISPNIDHLAWTGIRLEQNYVQPQCTPSRAALLTGMYPYHIGRQGGIIQPKGKLHMNSILKYDKIEYYFKYFKTLYSWKF